MEVCYFEFSHLIIDIEKNKFETAFSVIKKRFGEDMEAQKYRYQVEEIKIKMVLHNPTKAAQSAAISPIDEEFKIVHY